MIERPTVMQGSVQVGQATPQALRVVQRRNAGPEGCNGTRSGFLAKMVLRNAAHILRSFKTGVLGRVRLGAASFGVHLKVRIRVISRCEGRMEHVAIPYRYHDTGVLGQLTSACEQKGLGPMLTRVKIGYILW